MQKNWEAINTVKGENQVSTFVKFFGKQDGSPRIMFVGNSITWHGPNESLGWHGNWGMAASAPEKDYAHIVIKAISERFPDAAFCIVQAWGWESHYENCPYDEYFAPAKDFQPDIILSMAAGNIPAEKLDHDLFVESIHALNTYLSGGKSDVKIIRTSTFYGGERRNSAIQDYVKRVGAYYVDISDIRENPENLAIGLFEHNGVAHHPGDKGMQVLAERFLACINENNLL